MINFLIFKELVINDFVVNVKIKEIVEKVVNLVKHDVNKMEDLETDKIIDLEIVVVVELDIDIYQNWFDEKI